ncbi:MAG TPA: transcription antitermination factor NusB [Planctomycetota bacterium]|nr:transcription antitermination factor NusB [Planctomycetota bacterium]
MLDPARAEAHRRLLRTPAGRPPRETEHGRGLAEDLFLGVRRHAGTLDSVAGTFTKSAVGGLEPEMREALRLGVFQLLFHADTPAPLIVASTVELAGKSAKRRGFLNAVLRRLVEAFRHEPTPPGPLRSRRHVRTLPGRAAAFDRDVLPDPSADLERYLATQYALRRDFVAELRRELPLEIDALLEACNHPLPLALRVNRKATTREAAEKALADAGVRVLRRFGDVLEVEIPGAVEALAPLQAGLVTVQDVVPAETAAFLGAAPSEKILDLCAGVGGKTALLAEIAQRQGGAASILACDVQAVRLAKLQENVKRLGVAGVSTKLLKLDGSDVPGGPFDRVLIDVPCSNTGVLMKRVEARHRLAPDDVARVTALQATLLERGAKVTRPGGVLVYATCSLLADENRRVVGAFLNRKPGAYELEEERLRYPHRTGRDGGYMARLRRL